MSSESHHHAGHHGSVSASSDVPRKPLSKSAEHRRATKPIMEKRRRARINACLNELKALILEATNRDPSRHSKLEKADILEMTVRHLQNVQRQKMASAIAADPTVLNKFRAGFTECAKEVTNFFQRNEGFDSAVRQRLLAYLNNCTTSINTATMMSAANNPMMGLNPMSSGLAPTPASPNAGSNPFGSLNVQDPMQMAQALASLFPGNQLANFTAMAAAAQQGDINNNHPSLHERPSVVVSSEMKPNSAPLSASSLSSTSPRFSFSLPTPTTPNSQSQIFDYRHPIAHRDAINESPLTTAIPTIKTHRSHPWAAAHAASRVGRISPSELSTGSSCDPLSPGASDAVDMMMTDSSSADHSRIVYGLSKPPQSASPSSTTDSKSQTPQEGENVWRPW